MTKRNGDNAGGADRLLARLRQDPAGVKRMPPERRIAIIQREVSDLERPVSRERRVWIVWTAAALTFALLLIALAYAYETPGGIADWRYSRAAGYSETMSIPVGRTPEEAVLKFRQFPAMQVVHKEYIDGGALLFIKRNYNPSGTDLGIEFVRKTWLGWKWVMGGSYGLSVGNGTPEALNYMSMPFMKGIAGPFPIVYGQLSYPAVAKVNVTISGSDAGSYPAKTVAFGAEGQGIWFVILPKSAAATYGIEALDGTGAIIARKSFNDPKSFGTIPMAKGQ